LLAIIHELRLQLYADLARGRGWCPVGGGHCLGVPENPHSYGHNSSQIGAFSPECIPYASIESYPASPSMPFGRSLLWNIQQIHSSDIAVTDPCHGPRHRQGCLPLVMVLSCPAVGNLVQSACSSVLQAAQQQSVSGPSIASLLEASLRSEQTIDSGTQGGTGAYVSLGIASVAMSALGQTIHAK
jgi:hypothetical protein